MQMINVFNDSCSITTKFFKADFFYLPASKAPTSIEIIRRTKKHYKQHVTQPTCLHLVLLYIICMIHQRLSGNARSYITILKGKTSRTYTIRKSVLDSYQFDRTAFFQLNNTKHKLAILDVNKQIDGHLRTALRLALGGEDMRLLLMQEWSFGRR